MEYRDGKIILKYWENISAWELAKQLNTTWSTIYYFAKKLEIGEGYLTDAEKDILVRAVASRKSLKKKIPSMEELRRSLSLSKTIPELRLSFICLRCDKPFVSIRHNVTAASAKRDPPHYCVECRKRRVSHPYISKDGYRFILVDGKPMAEHRYVMEQVLSRPLRKYESVHHRDGDRAKNTPENLELWLSNHRQGIRAADLYCPHCNRPYFPTPELLDSTRVVNESDRLPEKVGV